MSCPYPFLVVMLAAVLRNYTTDHPHGLGYCIELNMTTPYECLDLSVDGPYVELQVLQYTIVDNLLTETALREMAGENWIARLVAPKLAPEVDGLPLPVDQLKNATSAAQQCDILFDYNRKLLKRMQHIDNLIWNLPYVVFVLINEIIDWIASYAPAALALAHWLVTRIAVWLFVTLFLFAMIVALISRPPPPPPRS